ncbi:Lsr2 family protein [Kitasatospora sp. RB6PN24]|uniref:Lsr2 family DNA-binding protein n=1 Tax=Kitasatospora humi TaxID=2893891 RepID=UPI001E455085|nr:histone-like nucleoid-structuring protein Lsr2 [Kitasatospora humi]MCC9307734.1 Lsr2 family protein [Kitasatospora humi]
MDAETAVAVSMYKDGATIAAITEATGLTQDQLAAAVTATGIPFAARTAAADPAGALIAWGMQHQSSRMQRLAEQARAALADLQQAQRREAVVSAAENRVQQAKEQLLAAEQALRAAKGSSATSAPSRSRPDRVEGARIRAWAREHGHQVGTAGIIPRHVVDAYYVAHPRADAA